MGSRGVTESNSAYKQTVKYIKEVGIPSSFYHVSDEGTKQIFRAIGEHGELTKEEQQVYDKIQYNEEKQSLWYNGSYREYKGYSEKEIEGVKKFMAHSLMANKRSEETAQEKQPSKQASFKTAWGTSRPIKNKTYKNFMAVMKRVQAKGYTKSEAESISHRIFDQYASNPQGMSIERLTNMIVTKEEHKRR